MTKIFGNGTLCASVVLALVCTGPVLSFEPRAQLNEPLVLSKTEGKAPLTISVKTPAELNDLWTTWQKRNSVHSKWGDGFSIDWGDGTGDGDASVGNGKTGKANEAGRHTYTAAGTYKVSASMYQFLPTDGHQVFWTGQATVTVKEK
jgi:hypothetical protein